MFRVKTGEKGVFRAVKGCLWGVIVSFVFLLMCVTYV